MDGCCVEVHGLTRTPTHNGKRGTVTGRQKGRVIVKMDQSQECVLICKKNLLAVFCVGLPCECRVQVRGDEYDQAALTCAIGNTDSFKFYVMHLGSTVTNNIAHQHFVKIRLPFVEMALSSIADIDREPLLRFYVCNYSQDDPGAKIIFGDAMRDASTIHPCFVDLSAEKAMRIASMQFQSPSEYRQLNIEMEQTLTMQTTQMENV